MIFPYACDGIGNRLTAERLAWSCTGNLLNQYTAINSDQPTCDADGNMTTGDMGRRIEKKVSPPRGSFPPATGGEGKHYKFAYNESFNDKIACGVKRE